MTSENLSGNWHYPTSVIAGAGSVAKLADCCRQLDIARPLLVTDPGLSRLPMVSAALNDCRAAGLNVRAFSDIRSNPSASNVANGVETFVSGRHDGVIAFGGGSAMDAAKSIALMAGQHRPLWEFEDKDERPGDLEEAAVAPIIALPTTAGTGSEVGRAALITDEQCQVKRIIFHAGMLPSKVILDPMLTRGLPPSITAATGMDALSHNLEALCSSTYHPMAEGIAVEGIRLVCEYLPRAVVDGEDMTARMQMMVASSMGATAFQKGLGAMHALAHPLGALYDAHHGLLNAILMPYVLQANRAAITGRVERTARYIGLADPGFDGFLSWVLELRERIGIPHTLQAIGIDAAQQALVGQMAVVDPTSATNPVGFSARQYSEIFVRALNGDV